MVWGDTETAPLIMIHIAGAASYVYRPHTAGGRRFDFRFIETDELFLLALSLWRAPRSLTSPSPSGRGEPSRWRGGGLFPSQNPPLTPLSCPSRAP